MALGTSACFLLTFTPHRKVLLKRRCERKKITKETKKKSPFVCCLPPSPTQRQAQLWMWSRKAPREQGTHLPRALEALHGLLVGEAAQTHSVHLQEPVTWEGDRCHVPELLGLQKGFFWEAPSQRPSTQPQGRAGSQVGRSPAQA